MYNIHVVKRFRAHCGFYAIENKLLLLLLLLFADNSLSVLKYKGLYIPFVLYCSYIFTLFLYHYIIGHVPTIYYHPTI